MKTLSYLLTIYAFFSPSDISLSSASALPTTGQAPSKAGFYMARQHVSKGGSSLCTSGIVHVSASTAANSKFDYRLPLTQAEATQTWISMWTAGSSFPGSAVQGHLHVNGTYNIGATICAPSTGNTSKLQILTHGIGFDRYYWDFAPGYSYVDAAVAAGYSVFLYDRLGVGVSSKEDPLHTIQSPLEVEILHSLVDQLREGLYNGIAYATVVGVGHSFGSAITQGLSATHSDDLDAAVLTAFSTNATGMPAFSLGQDPTLAAVDQPYRFNQLNNGYFVVASAVSNQQTFFHWPGFNPSILSLVEATKGTVTVGEFFTTSRTVQPAHNFSRPVALVAGNEDLAFCSGNCSYPHNILAEAGPALYPNVPAEHFDTYRAPNTGHGLNLHYSANATYAWIETFLKKNGV